VPGPPRPSFEGPRDRPSRPSGPKPRADGPWFGDRPGGFRPGSRGSRPAGPRPDGPRPPGPRPDGPRPDDAWARDAPFRPGRRPPERGLFPSAPPPDRPDRPFRSGDRTPRASGEDRPPRRGPDGDRARASHGGAGGGRPWPSPAGRSLRPGPAHPAQRPWAALPARPVPVALPPEASLGEGEEVVAGRHPVEEAFLAGRQALRLLVTPGRRDALERLVLHATTLRIPVVEVEGGSLTAVTGFDGHQGVALVVAARPAAAVTDILARAIERGEPALVLALDSLEDPQNVGTLLRSAEAAGVHGVIFPTRRQAPLTPAAVKASAGATEHLLLAPVDDLPGTLADLHVRGVRVVGTDTGASLTYREADLRGPLVLVIGSEGHGLASPIRRRCDLLVRIPMRGRIASLNAAVAGSVLVFEAAAQRALPEGTADAGPPGSADPPPEALGDGGAADGQAPGAEVERA
jgi:23S rRNA (guanosine2251-2'-O)-methyltransferase